MPRHPLRLRMVRHSKSQPRSRGISLREDWEDGKIPAPSNLLGESPRNEVVKTSDKTRGLPLREALRDSGASGYERSFKS